MEKKNEKTRIKKEYRHGQRSQKMVNFRCDLELIEWLDTQANKGRAINDAIRAAAHEWLASRNKADTMDAPTPLDDAEV